MIRRTTTMLAAAGSVAFLVGGMALTGSASAASLPSCATGYHCTNNGQGPSHGAGGYYGADDNHTHYRFVETTVTATPQLVNLNGALGTLPSGPGGVGVELCDPNTGKAAQISLGFNGTSYVLTWAVGTFGPTTANLAADPCIQTGFATATTKKTGVIPGVNTGDQIYLGIYYDPSGIFFHQISFGACDITSGVCRQVWSGTRFALDLTEFGIGAFSNGNNVQGGAINKFETFSSNNVTCYSCAHSVPITSVQPVNSFGAGGLYEAQFVNISSQVQMSPLDSLTPASFSMWNGSTGAV